MKIKNCGRTEWSLSTTEIVEIVIEVPIITKMIVFVVFKSIGEKRIERPGGMLSPFCVLVTQISIPSSSIFNGSARNELMTSTTSETPF